MLQQMAVISRPDPDMFQWAPTLVGECYVMYALGIPSDYEKKFQWAPTLGGECYIRIRR